MRPWCVEELLSDNEIRKKKEEIVEKTKAREEIERDFFIKPNKEPLSIPVKPDSKILDIVR